MDASKFRGHTPGPWRVEYSLIDSPSERKAIVQFGVEIRKADPELQANAALIAAAPALLAEVKRLRSDRQGDLLALEAIKLRREVSKLHALEAAGVDNWEGYGIAMDMYQEDDNEVTL